MSDFRFPDVGEGIAEGEIVKWVVKEGDSVKEHDVIVKIETDKAVVDIPSPETGKISKLYHKEGETIKVGEVLATIGDSTSKPEVTKSEKSVSVVGELEEASEVMKKPEIAHHESSDKMPGILPSVRRVARDMGVDLDKVIGTGKDGRITEQDIKSHASDIEDAGKEDLTSNIKIQKKYDFFGHLKRIPLKGIRKAIAKNMVKSKTTAPHVTHTEDIDVTDLWNHKTKESPRLEQRGIKLTLLPFVVFAVIQCLKKHPYLNSSLDDDTEEILLKEYYNIGIAVDTGDGLLVPNIKRADAKSIIEISKEIQDLASKARDKKLDLMEMKGGTFTITNYGSIGGIFATPVINYPEVAILGLGRAVDKPVVVNGKIEIRKIMPISLSFDHRVADGAESARFVNELKIFLEDIDIMLLTRKLE